MSYTKHHLMNCEDPNCTFCHRGNHSYEPMPQETFWNLFTRLSGSTTVPQIEEIEKEINRHQKRWLFLSDLADVAFRLKVDIISTQYEETE